MANPNKVRCIVCDRSLDSLQPRKDGMQPSRGVAFQTSGHYGTEVFDPMDGSSLEICVCDDCLLKAREKKIVLHKQPGKKFRIWGKKKSGKKPSFKEDAALYDSLVPSAYGLDPSPPEEESGQMTGEAMLAEFILYGSAYDMQESVVNFAIKLGRALEQRDRKRE